jgi:hypothetical protein
MFLLYKGNYYNRFKPLFKNISGKKVTEVCFGDTIIAEHCKKAGIVWTGIDINERFVKNAVKKGFNAEQQDLEQIIALPKADTLIISGALYHFQNDQESLFKKMLDCAPQMIISEPVINLSNNTGIIGKLAKASASVNGKTQAFRYTEKTLLETIEQLSKQLQFNYTVEERFDKDLIIVITK